MGYYIFVWGGVFFIISFFQSKICAQTAEPSVAFIENRGQWADAVLYKADIPGGALFIEKKRLVYVFQDYDALHEIRHGHQTDSLIRGHIITVDFLSGEAQQHSGSQLLKGKYNFFYGNDPDKWISGAQAFTNIKLAHIWPGIDLLLYAAGDSIKYNFEIAPTANASLIKLKYSGADNLVLNESGELSISHSLGSWIEKKPVAWYKPNAQTKSLNSLSCRYVLQENTLSFEFLEKIAHQQSIVIDPTVIFSTHTGSAADNFGFTATYDIAGNLYAGGIVYKTGYANIPTAPAQSYPVTPGAFQTSFQGGNYDIGITKFNSAGTARLYSTYLGGMGDEQPHSLICNDRSELFILGTTTSANFPVKAGCYDLSLNGGYDIVVVRLDSTGGVLRGSTYVGGSLSDGVMSDVYSGANNGLLHFYADNFRGEINLDKQGRPVIASCTSSPNFPIVNGFQSIRKGQLDGCAFGMDENLTVLRWSTYIGGDSLDAAYSIITDTSGNYCYIAGGTVSMNFPVSAGAYQTTFQGGKADGFVIKLTNTTGGFVLGSYFGTSAYDQNYFIQRDKKNFIYLCGQSEGNLPISAGCIGVPNSGQFFAKLNADLNTLIFQTMWGAGDYRCDIAPTAFLVDICENLYVSGWGGLAGSGNTTGLPVTPGAWQISTDGADLYFYVLRKNAAAIYYATFAGHSGNQEHVDGGTSRFDKNGIIYQAICAGCDNPAFNFPTTAGVVAPIKGSPRCNLAAMKISFGLVDATIAEFNVSAGAGFTGLTGCAPLTLNFIDQSINADSVLWYFSDTPGDSFNLATITHTFLNPGTYTVRQIAFKNGTCNGRDTIEKQVFVYPPPTAVLTPQTTPCSLTVTFDNTGSTFADSYIYLFGDGQQLATGGLGPITHTYAVGGTYNVSLIAISPDGRCRDTVTVPITLATPPVANFSITNLPCTREISFVNTSTGAGNFLWDFGDGNTSTNVVPPPHTYLPGGNVFTVKLIADPAGPCPSQKEVVITLTEQPPADFVILQNPCSKVVELRNITPNAGTVPNSWDFGDGRTSVTISPTVTYASPGMYNITLTMQPGVPTCTKTLTRSVWIPHVPTATFVRSPHFCDSTVTFTGTGPDAVDLRWDFGDGTTQSGSATSVSHTYADTGSYTVTLLVNPDSACPAVTSQLIRVEPKPQSHLVQLTAPCSQDLFFTDSSKFAGLKQYTFSDGTIYSYYGKDTIKHRFRTNGTHTVKLVSYNYFGNCPDSTEQVFNIFVPAELKYTAITAICSRQVSFQNLSINNDPINPLHFKWEFGDGTTDTVSNPVHTYLGSSTVFLVRLIGNPGALCSDTLVDSIRLIPAPNPSFDNTLPGCDGVVSFTNTTVHTLATAPTYYWDFGDGSTGNLKNPVHTYANAGNYTVKLITENGSPCADTLIKHIAVPVVAEAGFEAENILCVNDIAFRSTSKSLNSSTLPKIRWDFGDGTTDTSLSPRHRFADGIDSSVVRLIAGYDTPCPDTAEKVFYFYPKPKAAFIFNPPGCTKTVNFLNASAGRLPEPLRYFWDFGDGTTDTVYQPTHTFALPGQYRVKLTVQKNSACEDTFSAAVTILPVPSAAFSVDTNFCSRKVLLKTAAGYADTQIKVLPVINWLVNGTTIAGVDSLNYEFTPDTDSAIIALIADPHSPCADTARQTVYFYSKPKPAFEVTVLPCNWQVSIENKTATSLPVAQTYYWDFGDSTYDTTANPNNHTYQKAGFYTISLISQPNNQACADTARKTIYLSEIPEINQLSIEKDSCKPDIKLYAGGNRVRQWQWDLGDGKQDTGMRITHTYALAGKYKITLIANPDSICAVKIDTTIEIFVPTQAAFKPIVSGCDTIVQFENQSNAAHFYYWDLGDGTTITDTSRGVITHTFRSGRRYRIQLKTSNSYNNCWDSTASELVFPAIPQAAFTDSVLQCERTLWLKSSSQNGSDRWYMSAGTAVNWVPLFPPVNSDYFKVTQPNPDTVTIRLITGGEIACPDTVEKGYRVGFQSEAAFILPDSSCEPLVAPVDVSRFTDNPRRWVLTLTTAAGEQIIFDTLALHAPKFIAPVPGDYYVYVYTEPGKICGDSTVQRFRYLSSPVAHFTLEEPACSDLIILKAAEKVPHTTYSWNLADGHTEQGDVISHRYQLPGRYPLILTARTAGGCIDTAMFVYDYDPAARQAVYIPTGISPNGDGQNEAFCISGPGAPCVESVEIFSRWGHRVWYSTDFRECWQPVYEQTAVSEAVFVYVVKIPGRKMVGTVTIIR